MEIKNENQESDNYKLFRQCNEDFKPDTVLLIGNGAIRNGNVPLENVIYRFSNSRQPQDPTIHYLARMVFIYRSFRDQLLIKIANDQEIKKNIHIEEKEDVELLLETREILEDAYITATEKDEISLINKEKFQSYLSKNNTGVITINWDEVLWDWNNQSIENIIQLHGRCSVHNSLILPTELTLDENIFEVIKSKLNAKPNIIKQLSYYYRNDSVRKALRKVHNRAYDWLVNTKQLIIYGVAFNIYDSELLSLFPPKPINNLEEIIIINPNPTHRDIAANIAGKGAKRIDFNAYNWVKNTC
jgi:hypothetical protein